MCFALSVRPSLTVSRCHPTFEETRCDSLIFNSRMTRFTSFVSWIVFVFNFTTSVRTSGVDQSDCRFEMCHVLEEKFCKNETEMKEFRVNSHWNFHVRDVLI